MKYHSQNLEAGVVLNYFNGRIGTVLDIGANDGITFSNSYDLVKSGWFGVLVEPSPKAYNLLGKTYKGSNNVTAVNAGISTKTGTSVFFESGPHLPDRSDTALLSGIEIQHRWRALEYERIEVQMYSFNDFVDRFGLSKFEFITIDAEGHDWHILKQIDLNSVGCQCLCIEWNSDDFLRRMYTGYCATFDLMEIHRNAENIIFAR